MNQKLGILLSFLAFAILPSMAYSQSVDILRLEKDILTNEAQPYGDSDWLDKWLSAPLPGQPARTRPKQKRFSIDWPVSPSQRRLPNRVQKASPSQESPSLKGQPFEGHLDLPGMYLGIGLVSTTGNTTWNHDATSSSATLGNPSSELTYDQVSTLALELTGGMRIYESFFLRGNIGVGATFGDDGTFRDDDFRVGQTLFSSTNSAIPNTDLFYFTIDAGKEIINIGDGQVTMSLFTGYQYWRESYEAYGLHDLLTGQTTQSDDTAVISNVVEWNSLRLGALGTYKPTDRLEWALDFAFIPVTSMHNEDSHLLRTGSNDLGPAPNVIMDGTGYGFEWALGMNYLITPRVAVVFDVRYWSLMSEGDITLRPNTSPSTYPLNDLDTVRYGANIGLRYVF